MEKNISVPFKFTVSQSRRRARLGIPLRLDALRAAVVKSFPALKGLELKITYVDDEEDEISVLSDAELEEARSVFIKLGRVLSFTVSAASKKSSKNSAPDLPPAISSKSPCKKKKISHTQQMQTDILLENGSLAQLLPNNTLVAPKAGRRTQLSTASIPGLTVNNGKWIYEVVLGSDGISQIGWADADFSCQPWNGKGVGDDAHSWAMDGCRLIKSHKGAPSPFGRRWGSNGWQQWKAGDVFGCVYDADNGEISFLANGTGLGLAFCVPAHTPLRPAVSLSACQKLGFSLEAGTLRFPVEGAKPIADALLSPPAHATSAKNSAKIQPCMPIANAVPISMPVVVPTPLTAHLAGAATLPVRATAVPKAQPMKFGLHPGPFFIVDRVKASRTNPNYLHGFECDVKDESVCSQKTDTHKSWFHCPGQQYDVCKGCFMKYIVPAAAAPNHFLTVPIP